MNEAVAMEVAQGEAERQAELEALIERQPPALLEIPAESARGVRSNQ